MAVRIPIDSIPERRGGVTIFPAEENGRPLEIWITARGWEYFWKNALIEDDDLLRLDLALRCLELAATKREASVGTDGVRFVFVG